ncbi:ComEC/Rec2 family competence protein [Thermodesulfobium narugense]|uniref:ComEC/Rec2 family competence protein n=1 Tax=Thermodesulfobium narugense TaxID=184064 RepID=UPI0012B506D6|nr:ComEC/Rec2 family competence protein [Thermodesulfobium narugense]
MISLISLVLLFGGLVISYYKDLSKFNYKSFFFSAYVINQKNNLLKVFLQSPKPFSSKIERVIYRGKTNFQQGDNIFFDGELISNSLIVANKIEKTGENSTLFFKKYVEDAIKKNMSEQTGKVFGAMLYGDDLFQPPKEVYDAFNRTGLLHILVVSGAQVSMIFSLFFYFLKRMSINPLISFFVISFFTSLFCLNVGLDPPVIRAGGLILFIALAELFRINYSSFNLTLLVMILFLIFDPYSLFDISFQLTFLCIFAMFFTGEIRKKFNFNNYLFELFLLSFSVFIFLFPVIVNYFNNVSVLSLFTNVFITPFLEIFLLIGFVLSFFMAVSGIFTQYIGHFITYITDLVIYIVKGWSNFPLSSVLFAKIPLFSVYLYYLLLALIIFNKYNSAVFYIFLTLLFLSLIFMRTTDIKVYNDKKGVVIESDEGKFEFIKQAENCTVKTSTSNFLIPRNHFFKPLKDIIVLCDKDTIKIYRDYKLIYPNIYNYEER